MGNNLNKPLNIYNIQATVIEAFPLAFTLNNTLSSLKKFSFCYVMKMYLKIRTLRNHLSWIGPTDTGNVLTLSGSSDFLQIKLKL